MSIKKIVVIGPESTGKSTLSSRLAAGLNTVWVPEYARPYLETLDRDYTEGDLLEIAKGQIALEESMQQQAKDYLICDTDLYVIKVWNEHKYNRCHQWVLEEISHRKYDGYLLTDIDMPWEFDMLREYPEETMRRYFFKIYKDIVQNSGLPWAIVSGNEEERLQAALSFIQQTFTNQ